MEKNMGRDTNDQCGQGDENTEREIDNAIIKEFYKYASSAYMALCRTLNEYPLIEHDDVVQKAVMKAVNNYSNFRHECEISTWLFTIVKNTIYNEITYHSKGYRDSRKRYTLMVNDGDVARDDNTFDMPYEDIYNSDNIDYLPTCTSPLDRSPEDVWMQIQDCEEVYEKIERLQPHEQETILLYMNGTEYHNISKIMDVNEGTVKSRIFNIKQKLLR